MRDSDVEAVALAREKYCQVGVMLRGRPIDVKGNLYRRATLWPCDPRDPE